MPAKHISWVLQTKFQSNNFWGAQIHFWLQLSEKNFFFLPRFYRKLVKKWEKKIRKIQQVLWEGDSNKKWECFGKWGKVARELIVVARFCVSYRKYVFHRPQKNFLNFVRSERFCPMLCPMLMTFHCFHRFYWTFFVWISTVLEKTWICQQQQKRSNFFQDSKNAISFLFFFQQHCMLLLLFWKLHFFAFTFQSIHFSFQLKQILSSSHVFSVGKVAKTSPKVVLFRSCGCQILCFISKSMCLTDLKKFS